MNEYDDLIEDSPFENCPQCGRSYDDIEFDYQCWFIIVTGKQIGRAHV